MAGQPHAGIGDPIAAFDRAATRQIAETDSRLLDMVMPRLSWLANHGLLWIGLGAGIWAGGDRPRQAGRLARPGWPGGGDRDG